MVKRGASEKYALDQEQVGKLIDTAIELEDKVAIKLMVLLGLRASEVVHFNKSWVAGDSIHIPPSQLCDCADCRKRGGVWRPKSEASIRILPIPEALRDDLNLLLSQKPEGLKISRQAVWKRVKKMAKNAEIRVRGLSKETIFPHALRATSATTLAEHLEAAQLCYIEGWADIKMGAHYVNIARARAGAHRKLREIYG